MFVQMGQNLSEKQLAKAFTRLDKDGGGSVDFGAVSRRHRDSCITDMLIGLAVGETVILLHPSLPPATV